MIELEYFIGVDVGTQSTKTLVLEAETGKILGKASKTYGLIEDLPQGHREQNPYVWIEAVDNTIIQALNLSKIDKNKVRAIGISGQQHGLVPLDEMGDVIRPAKLWNDTSTAKECEILTEKLGGLKAVIDYLGLSISPGFTASKIFWLKRNEPKNYHSMKTILLPHDYLNYYLTGKRIMEYGDASGTALMNIRTREWCKEILDTIGSEIIEKLPPIHGSNEPVGTIRKELAEKYGFTDDVLVSAGGGDNMMAAIGTGNTQKGVVTAGFGTSGTIFAYSDFPLVDPHGEIAGFCDSTNAWLPLICTMNVTVATEYIRNLFDLSYSDLEKIVKETPAGSNGLILLPYFEGERTPNVPEGTGVIYGLNQQTFNRAHFVRAAMEGPTMGMNYGLNRMKKLGIKPQQIRVTGGGSKNAAWRQIAADVFKTEVICLKIDEGAAFGAALQALWTYRNQLGDKFSIQEITDQFVKVDEKTRAYPKPSNVDKLKDLQIIQDKISLSLRKTFIKHRKYLNQHSF